MMAVYEVQIWQGGRWTRWGIYLYERIAQEVARRRQQEGQQVQVHVLQVD